METASHAHPFVGSQPEEVPQSPSSRHPWPIPQGGQEPPQSTSVSLPSLIRSSHTVCASLCSEAPSVPESLASVASLPVSAPEPLDASAVDASVVDASALAGSFALTSTPPLS